MTRIRLGSAPCAFAHEGGFEPALGEWGGRARTSKRETPLATLWVVIQRADFARRMTSKRQWRIVVKGCSNPFGNHSRCRSTRVAQQRRTVCRAVGFAAV